MKKLLCTILALVLTAALPFSAMAADKITLGIAQFAEHGSLDNCREGFLAGLAENGFIEGENLKIEYQNAQQDMGIANQIAIQFVSNNVDMICAIATPIAQACYNAAEGSDIPTIFTAVSDPVAAMLAGEDKMPLGNTTGTSDFLPIEAQLKLIRALMPDATKIGILYTTGETNSESQLKTFEAIAPNYGFEIVIQGISAVVEMP